RARRTRCGPLRWRRAGFRRRNPPASACAGPRDPQSPRSVPRIHWSWEIEPRQILHFPLYEAMSTIVYRRIQPALGRFRPRGRSGAPPPHTRSRGMLKKLVLETTAPFQGLAELVAYDEGLFKKEGLEIAWADREKDVDKSPQLHITDHRQAPRFAS